MADYEELLSDLEHVCMGDTHKLWADRKKAAEALRSLLSQRETLRSELRKIQKISSAYTHEGWQDDFNVRRSRFDIADISSRLLQSLEDSK